LTTRVYFATDIHGSEKCFVKFLSAAKFYKAQVLILGGDITGKVIVPLIKDANGYHAMFRGLERKATNDAELEKLERDIRYTGYYPYRTDDDGFRKLQEDPAAQNSLFRELMLGTFKSWIQLADEKLGIQSGIKTYMTGGNDDLPEIKPIMASSKHIIDPEDKVVEIDSKHEMISSGFSNPTPWKTPRECSEEELADKIQAMVSQVRNMKNCIFNLHVPPIDSGLDTCPKLDENLKPTIVNGEPVTTVGGSTSVRKSIEENQPLLGLHGHIHESKGFLKIGKTLCINAGSESSEGILRGVIADLDNDSVKNFMLTSG
jgi:Icc-related predicted phosphoesterase